MAKDKDTASAKEELMRRVLGKNRGMNIHTSSVELSRLRENSEELSKRIGEATETAKNNADSSALLNTIIENQRTLQEISEEVDISDLKAQIARDFGGASDSLGAATKAGFEPQMPETERVLWKDVAAMEVQSVFSELEAAIKSDVLGQGGAVHDVVEGLMRPYIQGVPKNGLRGVIYVHGPRGSGRHFLVEKAVAAACGRLVEGGCAGFASVDMSNYQESGSEGVFVQDMYSALFGGNAILLIENFDRAHIGISSMLGELVKNGVFKLKKRYIEKNGVLQESDKSLHRSYLSEINGNGKLIIFVSDKKKQALTDVYGRDVSECVLDVATTGAFDAATVKKIAELQLSKLQTELAAVSKAKVAIADSVRDAAVALYDEFDGVYSFKGAIDDIRTVFLNSAVERVGHDAEIFYDGAFAIRYFDGTRVEVSSADGELEAIKAEISEVVGLDEVKEYLYSLENLVKAGANRRRMGLKTDAVTRHMIFTGNPGTGKTTVARLVSRLMKAIGALEQGHLVEVTRADLVGRYVGHTAPLTMNVIKSAIGGVLFIDEAYSLYRGRDDSFGLEAIDALVKGMEDNRENLVVILAGYSAEMEVFLTSNSGLRSRFPRSVHFSDYNADELLKISVSLAKRKDYVISESVHEALRDYLGEANKRESSNGRLARNTVEAAIIKQAGRVRGGDAETMRTLLPEDFDLQPKTREL